METPDGRDIAESGCVRKTQFIKMNNEIAYMMVSDIANLVNIIGRNEIQIIPDIVFVRNQVFSDKLFQNSNN